jgi:hypothetical protein
MPIDRPLLCRWGWHLWTAWTMPPGWRATEERRCGRRGCTAVERRDARTKEPVR